MLTRSGFVLGVGLAIAAPRGARAADTIALRVGTTTDQDTAAVLYGVQSGIFERLGLRLDVQPMSSGSVGVSAVVGGSLQFAKSSVVALAAAHVHGLPLKIIAPSTIYTPDRPVAGLIVALDSPIRSPKDLAGKTVGVSSLLDSRVFTLRAWVDQVGGDYRAVKFVEIPGPSVLAALFSGRIDATVASYPLLPDAMATGRARNLGDPNGAIGKRWVLNTWYTTDTYAATQSDVVHRFQRGLYASAVYANAHPDEMEAVLAPFAGLEKSNTALPPRSLIGTTMNPNEYQVVIDVAAKYGYIEKAFPAREFLQT